MELKTEENYYQAGMFVVRQCDSEFYWENDGKFIYLFFRDVVGFGGVRECKDSSVFLVN